MKLVLLHARAATLELLRYPTFSVPTLAFPALFFLLFVAPRRTPIPTDAAARLVRRVRRARRLRSSSSASGSQPSGNRRGSGSCGRCRPFARPVRGAGPFGGVVRPRHPRRSWSRRRSRRPMPGSRRRDGSRSPRRSLSGACRSPARDRARLLGLAAKRAPDRERALPRARVPRRALDDACASAGSRCRISPFVPTRQFGNVLWGAPRATSGDPRDWLLLLGWSVVFAAPPPGATAATKAGGTDDA